MRFEIQNAHDLVAGLKLQQNRKQLTSNVKAAQKERQMQVDYVANMNDQLKPDAIEQRRNLSVKDLAKKKWIMQGDRRSRVVMDFFSSLASNYKLKNGTEITLSEDGLLGPEWSDKGLELLDPRSRVDIICKDASRRAGVSVSCALMLTRNDEVKLWRVHKEDKSSYSMQSVAHPVNFDVSSGWIKSNDGLCYVEDHRIVDYIATSGREFIGYSAYVAKSQPIKAWRFSKEIHNQILQAPLVEDGWQKDISHLKNVNDYSVVDFITFNGKQLNHRIAKTAKALSKYITCWRLSNE